MIKLFVHKNFKLYLLIFWLILYVFLLFWGGVGYLFFLPFFFIITTVSCIKKEAFGMGLLILLFLWIYTLLLIVFFKFVLVFDASLFFLGILFFFFASYYFSHSQLRQRLKKWLWASFGIMVFVSTIYFFLDEMKLSEIIPNKLMTQNCHFLLVYNEGKGMTPREVEKCEKGLIRGYLLEN